MKNFIKGKKIKEENRIELNQKTSTTNLSTKWFEIPYKEEGIDYTTIKNQIKQIRITLLFKILKTIKNKSIKKVDNWMKPLLIQLKIANNNITKSFDILFLNQNKIRKGTFETPWKNIISSLWIEVFKQRNELPIRINWQEMNYINRQNIYNHMPIWNNKFLTLSKANSNPTTLLKSASIQTQNTIYNIQREKIYSFSNMLYFL